MKIKYLLVLLLLFLVGCSKVTINKDSFINKIDSNFEDMLIISKQELNSHYDIDTTKFKDYIFKISKDDPINIYILVSPISKKEAKNEIEKFFKIKLKEVNEINKKRIENRYDNNYGDYLFYIVSNKNKEIYKEMNEFIKNE